MNKMTSEERRAFFERFDKDKAFHKKVKTALTKNLRSAVRKKESAGK